MSNAKTCPVCETQNELGAKHCEVCGEPLPIPQAGAQPAPSQPAAPAATADSSAAPAATADSSTAGFAYGDEAVGAPPSADAAQGNPSQPHARAEIDAAAPGSPDQLAASVTETSFDSQSAQPDRDDVSALEKFDELLNAPSDAQPPQPKGFEREQHDTIVDHPAVQRSAPAPVEATASLVVYQNREPVHTHDIVHDETLVGRADPTSNAYPQLDMTPFDDDRQISRKHCSLLRESGKYFVRPLSGAGTQVNNHIIDLGERMEIEDGDVLILAGAIALKFSLEQ